MAMRYQPVSVASALSGDTLYPVPGLDPTAPAVPGMGYQPQDGILPGADFAPTPAAADEPFYFGPGGRRMTPDEIKRAHQLASEQMAAGSDYSPVGHWTQGLARVANALTGALGEREAREAEQANRMEGMSVAQALLRPAGSDPQGGNPRETILSALANPYVGADVHGIAGKLLDQDYEANKPQYFTSNNDRVAFDPRTGRASVLYDGKSDAEDYAASLALQPGTPEHSVAMQDYVLRASGPTAFGFDVDLEEARQGNRVELEGTRQRNRLSLRQTPTYANLHPRPAAAGGSGGNGGGGGRPPTMAGTMAPILAKVSRGETLTAAEQQAWNMYRPPSRKPGGGGGGADVGGGIKAGQTATGPGGKKVQWNGSAWVPAG